MPSFKPKANKKLKFNKKSAVTLDNKHCEFLNEFSRDENDRIPELKTEKSELLDQLNNQDDLTIDQKMDITDRINEINQQIKECKN